MFPLALVLFLQVGPANFKEPVRVTEKQRAFLRGEARKVKEHLDRTKKALSALEKPVKLKPGVIIKNFVQNFGDLKTTLSSNVSTASDATREAQSQFNALSENEGQKQAGDVFFGDILGRYSQLSRDIDGLEEKSYPAVKKNTILALELNAKAYETVADAGAETFDLEVDSFPQDAAVSYKRKGDPYKDHPRPTNTTIENLVYAVWTVRARKQGFQDQEKLHDPFNEKNHVVHFDLKQK